MASMRDADLTASRPDGRHYPDPVSRSARERVAGLLCGRSILVVSDTKVLRRDVPPEIPADVDSSDHAKARGMVTLPRRVNWSEADPTYDFNDRRERALAYEQILSEGGAEDVRRFIDVDELIELWDELVLPRAVSQAWIQWLEVHRGVRVRDWRERGGVAGPTAG